MTHQPVGTNQGDISNATNQKRMTSKMEYFLYLSLGLVLLVFLGLAFLSGPIGWVAGAFLLVGVYFLAKWSGLLSHADRSSTPTKVNCSACGGRTPIEDGSCSYCGEEL